MFRSAKGISPLLADDIVWTRYLSTPFSTNFMEKERRYPPPIVITGEDMANTGKGSLKENQGRASIDISCRASRVYYEGVTLTLRFRHSITL